MLDGGEAARDICRWVMLHLLFLSFPFLPDFLDANAKLPIKGGGIVQYNMDTNQAYTFWPVQASTRPKLSHLGAEEAIYPLPPLTTIGIGKSGILLWDLHSVLFDAAGKWDIRH